ncbi:MAG: N-6 DNA methylase [Verrucomicrobia bacterium]|nr:N-6 DNA methylase [Verrucomicrobiota bacterium]
MMVESTEWTFAADVAKWMSLFLHGQARLPFADAKVEQKGAGSAQRSDLVLYDRDGKSALTGEIKLPDSVEGQTPFHAKLVIDARRKASRLGCPFFFTWNVNRLVLWQSGQEHEIRVLDAAQIRTRAELGLPNVERQLRDGFIPGFLELFARIFRGEEAFGALALDQRFIRRLESCLYSLTNCLFPEVLERYRTKPAFRKDLNQWMREQDWLISEDPEILSADLDRATRLACYITGNKLVFYQALRRTRRFKLPKLEIPEHLDKAEGLSTHFNELFHQAKAVTHDYQTIFDGGFIDRVPFLAEPAVERWRAFVQLLSDFDFRDLDQDVIGHIFQDLLGPEERHRWGQHYTQPEIADLINAFCIRKPEAVVLDPASGSGTFNVRAYARKKCLARGALTHADLLKQVFACEISEYAAHLTALNLATRDLIDGDNFPQVARADFFDTDPAKPFCSVPDTLGTRRLRGEMAERDVFLPQADAVVGNPPYVRQEGIGALNKARYLQVATAGWNGMRLSGRSDLHVYFWPHAGRLLKDGGFFGFLTSASWLDVDYGFKLQEWILHYFEIVAILESNCEPWFTGARVATCVTILRRCSDATKRNANLVKFVQLRKPIGELIESDGTEIGQQEAAERFRDLIENTTETASTPDYRILVKPQQELWDEGCRDVSSASDHNGNDDESEDEDGEPMGAGTETQCSLHEPALAYGRQYHGSKWGVHLRAPDFYFELMRRFGRNLVPLGQIASVRYGFKSGCDDFFVLEDITKEALAAEKDTTAFKLRYRCPRKEVADGRLAIVRAGDGTEHPVEPEFLMPEVQSLMHIDRVMVRQRDVPHLLLLVSKSKSALKNTYVLDYIHFGERETFGGKIPTHKRPSCSGRAPWYDLSGYPVGRIILPIIVQYRHIVSWNRNKLPVNHALMVVDANPGLSNKALAAVLNSTLTAFIKPYFSRKLGNEANTQLDVYAAKMLPVVNVSALSRELVQHLEAAFDALEDRPVTGLVEERLLAAQNWDSLKDRDAAPRDVPEELKHADRRALDREVLLALGIPEVEVEDWLRRLYEETTRFFNEARLVEFQAMRNRLRSKKGRIASPHEIAREILEEFDPSKVRRLPADFLDPSEPLDTLELPAGKATIYEANDFLDARTLVIGKKRLSLRHRAQVELAKTCCDFGAGGFLKLPVAEAICRRVLHEWEAHLSGLSAEFRRLASERTDDEERIETIVAELLRSVHQPQHS